MDKEDDWKVIWLIILVLAVIVELLIIFAMMPTSTTKKKCMIQCNEIIEQCVNAGGEWNTFNQGRCLNQISTLEASLDSITNEIEKNGT